MTKFFVSYDFITDNPTHDPYDIHELDQVVDVDHVMPAHDRLKIAMWQYRKFYVWLWKKLDLQVLTLITDGTYYFVALRFRSRDHLMLHKLTYGKIMHTGFFDEFMNR